MIEETKRRGPIYAEYRPPGPVYNKKTTVGSVDHCKTYEEAPAYSIGLKRRDGQGNGPGPAYSYDSRLTNRGLKEVPSYTLSSRHPVKSPYVTPGPGSYDTHHTKEGMVSNEAKPTSVIMGQRTNWPFKNEAPPPNTYRVRTGIGSSAYNERNAPSWTLKSKSIVGGSQYAAIKANIPGPGSYGSVEPDVFKKSTGRFTIQGRTQMKNYNSVLQNPGPGSYDLDVGLRSARRGPSMGVRHSDYMCPLITDIDII